MSVMFFVKFVRLVLDIFSRKGNHKQFYMNSENMYAVRANVAYIFYGCLTITSFDNLSV
jgi:hypothetical protein